MNEYDVVVVGGVAAGTKVAAKARRENLDWKIAVITQDDDISYAGCGLPYYLGGVIETRGELVVKTPEELKITKEINVLTRHEVTSIDPDGHTVVATKMDTGEVLSFTYKKLVLATGAKPVRPPIPGIDSDRIYTLRTVTDADAIKEMIESGQAKDAVIVGGGFIGIEVAENLIEQGLRVSIVEMMPQILPQFDREVAAYMENHLILKGADIRVNDRVEAFEEEPDGRLKVKTSKTELNADFVLLSIGVVPNTELAKNAGLELGVRGTIKVDASGRTSHPDIFAAGDCVSMTGLYTGKETWMPMGSTANKQARATALTMTGQADGFPGILGTMVVKVFDVNAGRTGMSEREAREAGFDVVSCLVPSDDRAHYYPGAKKIILKMVADRATEKVLGIQIYGEGVIDKPLDAMVAAISMNAKVSDIQKMDFAYAPPFSMAINPLNLTANVLMNKMQGKLETIPTFEVCELIKRPDWDGIVLDIREIPEFQIATLPGAVNIPMLELKERLGEILKYRDKDVFVLCGVGLRAYESYLRLKHMGFTRAKVIEGGLKAWCFDIE